VRQAALALVVAAVVVAAAWIGRVAEGRRSLADADAAVARGDAIEAILAAKAAAAARCPFCSHEEAGYAKLESIANDAEKRADDATAFAAWRAVRSAALSSAILSREPERRARAEIQIARLGHRIDAAAAAAGGTPTPSAAEDRLRAALATNDLPSGAACAVIGAGGLVFLVFAWRFASKRGSRAFAAAAAAGAAVSIVGALAF
jgi:hypothetical protein